MENLIRCSTILYDRDIQNKMNEITELTEELKSYKLPIIKYSNKLEKEIIKKEAYEIIKLGVDKWIVENEYEYATMRWWPGITDRQLENIIVYIEQGVNLIIKNNNDKWSNNISVHVMNSIEGFFQVFGITDLWDILYTHLSCEGMSELVYNNIIWQLDDILESFIEIEEDSDFIINEEDNINEEDILDEADLSNDVDDVDEADINIINKDNLSDDDDILDKGYVSVSIDTFL